MRIGLVDIDYNNKFPNIALMKLSAYHKAKGDHVEWYMAFGERYDIVYMSKVFSFSKDYTDVINADKVVKGGSGYAIHLVNGREVYDKDKDKPLPAEVEAMFPDYSIYPTLTKDTAYGFLSRGCPRGCDFCHVAAKEGRKSYKVANLNNFYDIRGGQKCICLCDPNILACKDWKELLQQLIDSKAYVDFNQGLDARLMTEEKAKLLSQIKMKEVHFAWDRYKDKNSVLSGLKIFSEYVNMNSHNSIVFTIVNFDTSIEQDLERIYTLRDMGYWAYVMIYDKEHCNKIYRRMQRWCNNRIIFAKCPKFEDYKE